MANDVLYSILIDYIEANKINYNISYQDTIDELKALINSIEREYEDLEEQEDA